MRIDMRIDIRKLYAAVLLVLVVSGLAYAQAFFGRSVSHQMAFTIGSRASDTLENSSVHAAATNDSAVLIVAGVGGAFDTDTDRNFTDTEYMIKVTQGLSDNRFIIGLAPGGSEAISDDLATIEDGVPGGTLGETAAPAPQSFPLFIRLEYDGIDLSGSARWFGAGKLRIKNQGISDDDRPQVSIEVTD